ncbi:MAG TPA: hypothetical protein VGK74_16855 [Symbiobacteriaceae bacterium]
MTALLPIVGTLMLPAFLAAIPVSAIGILRRNVWWPLAGALMATPISLYLAGTPRSRWRRAGLLVLLPIPIFLGWFAWEIAGEGTGPIPPAPHVAVAGTQVPVIPAHACWPSGGGTECTTVPDKVVEHSGLQPAEVPAGSRLQVSFDVQPEFWDLFGWQTGRPVHQDVDRAGTMALPATPGLYVYDLSARWRQGGADWVIYLKLK